MFKTCRTTTFVVPPILRSSFVVFILILIATPSITFISLHRAANYFALGASVEANNNNNTPNYHDNALLPVSYGYYGYKQDQAGPGRDKSIRSGPLEETQNRRPAGSILSEGDSSQFSDHSRHSLGKQTKQQGNTVPIFTSTDNSIIKQIDGSTKSIEKPTTTRTSIQDAHHEKISGQQREYAHHAASAASQKYLKNYLEDNNNSKTTHTNSIDHSSNLKLTSVLLTENNINHGNNIIKREEKWLARDKRYVANNHAQDGTNPECESIGSSKPALFALRCDDSESTPDGAIIVRAHTSTRLYLIGRNLYSNLTIALTEQDGASQDDCTHVDRIKSLKLFVLSFNVGEVVIDLPPPEKQVPYYFCIREDHENARWFHQGSEPWLKIYVKKEFMPLWFQVMLIAGLLSLSGLFSGLNLGLMSLDKNELQVIMKCGTRHEQKYAATIEPVRRRGNYLLCSILFSNTLVNSTISVLLEDLSTGLIAIIMSTVLIVLFGEILPQAFCSRHGLAVGAKTIWITQACMFITAPLSYLVSYCLDWALGEEIGHAYDRDRLMEFIRVTKDLNNLYDDEVNIIAGALKIKSVRINEVMTRIEDVFMIDTNSKLDFDTMQEIVCRGYSRIPVHEPGNRRNIEAVLFTKDLALVDPDDETPISTIIKFHNHPRMFVYEDTTLDKVLNEFKTGSSHMAIVQKVVDDGDKDPYLEVTGIVTLEDVIEEIIQMEINDETDTVSDNRRKRRRKDAQVRKDFSQFTNLGSGDSSSNVITPQLCLAAYQYLATTVEPFTPTYLSDSILRRLLSQKIFYKVKAEDDKSLRRLYTAGEPADYFIMILEGRVHVVCGKENLVFDGGPFSFFGKAALTYLPGSDRTDSIVPALALPPPPSVPSPPQQQPPPSANVTPVQVATSGGGAAGRRESTKPTMSRRESLAKIVGSSLGVAKKPLNIEQQQQLLATSDANLSPVSMSANNNPNSSTEVLELTDRGLQYFRPDYTVEIIANTSYLKVTRNDYLTALKATMVERKAADDESGGGGGGGGGTGSGGGDIDNQDMMMITTSEGSPTLSIELGHRQHNSG